MPAKIKERDVAVNPTAHLCPRFFTENIEPHWLAHEKGVYTHVISAMALQEEMSGPPYSIDIREMDRLFGHGYDFELLTSNDVLKDYPRFEAKGCTAVKEEAFLLVKR